MCAQTGWCGSIYLRLAQVTSSVRGLPHTFERLQSSKKPAGLPLSQRDEVVDWISPGLVAMAFVYKLQKHNLKATNTFYHRRSTQKQIPYIFAFKLCCFYLQPSLDTLAPRSQFLFFFFFLRAHHVIDHV